MKKTIKGSILVVGLLFVSFTSFAQNSKFYDRDGKFKILFPTEPTSQSQVQPTEMGKVTVYMFISETSDGSAYMVSYVDYPADKMSGLDKKALLDRAKNGFNGALGISTTDSMYMNYGKHQGIMFHASSGNTFASMRDYLVDNRLYQLGILQYATITDQQENDFFDSFELVK